jgi:hypothetical protein
MMPASAIEVAGQVECAWSAVPAPPHAAMEYFTIGWGSGERELFLDVKPGDVDREHSRFLVADVLAEMSPVATAAYLGPYLVTFLEDLAFQEREGYFSEPMVRGAVLSVLTLPTSWSAVLQPNLSLDCKHALGAAVSYMLRSRELLKLEAGTIGALEALSRAIAADVRP